MAPSILLLGANGQVGWELRRSLTPVGPVVALGRAELDLGDLDQVVRAVRDMKPAIVVNAAAYTAVDKAETEQAIAFRLNAELPAVLAGEVKHLGGLLVDYSTDYVFDGMLERPYRESDPANPLSTYGLSKLQGLHAIEQSGCRHLVFRVSWVYAARAHNFVKTILRLAKEKTSLRVVADQVGAPTPADLIADVTAQVLGVYARGREVGGVFNLAPAGSTSWCDFARAIVSDAAKAGERFTLGEEQISAVTTAAYPTAARRPANSTLDTAKLRNDFALYLPEWRDPLSRIIREIVAK